MMILSPHSKILLLSLIILASLFLIYGQSLHYDFLNYDDDEYVVNNPAIKSLEWVRVAHLFDRPYVTLYIPITMLSYWVDYQIWGLNPFGFHFTNLALHFLNSVLVFFLIYKIRKNLVLAFFVVLVFAIHPVQIESVVWIAERKNLLSSFFLLGAVLFYWNAAESKESLLVRRNLLSSLLMFFLALLSKPSAVIFPLLVIAINHCFFKSQKIRENLWFYSMIVFGSFLVTGLTVFNTSNAMTTSYGYHGGSFLNNFWIMCTVFWRYIGLLIYPYHQNVMYSSVTFESPFELPVLLSLSGFVLMGLILLRYKNEHNMLFWFLWFFILLLPVSNLVAPFPSIMNDRYLYLPIVGFFAVIFIWIQGMSEKLMPKFTQWKAVCSTAVMLCVLIPFVLGTVHRVPDWSNNDVFFHALLHRDTKPPLALTRLFYAIQLIKKKEYAEALNYLEQAKQLQDQNKYIKSKDKAYTYLEMGIAESGLKQFDLAENSLKKAIELRPDYDAAYNQLGVVYRFKGDFELSERMFQKALGLSPENVIFLNNYALLLLNSGRIDEAIKKLTQATRIDPDYMIPFYNLGLIYSQQGKMPESFGYFRQYYRKVNVDVHDPCKKEPEIFQGTIYNLHK